MQLEEFSEGEVIDINEESCCEEKDEDDPEERHWQKLHIKGTLRYFMTVKIQKIKCWKMIQTQIYNTLCMVSYTMGSKIAAKYSI